MTNTSIQWTQRVWNPLRGCSLVSAGCRSCYAMRQAHRFSGPGGAYEGLTKMTPAGPQWTGKVRLVPEVLEEPLRWRKPSRVFVNSMSDLFHDDVPDEFIDRVFGVMAAARTQTFQVLTKRPERMRRWFERVAQFDAPDLFVQQAAYEGGCAWAIRHGAGGHLHKVKGTFLSFPWPLPNVWLGVSVEDQRAADERIPLLLQTPAAVRFLSCEPLLGQIRLHFVDRHAVQEDDSCADWCDACRRRRDGKVPTDAAIDWVIVGGESGPGARPCDVAWIRAIVEQCKAASVPAFVKQLGALPVADGKGVAGFTMGQLSGRDHGHGDAHCAIDLRDRKGGDPSEWPEDLRVRQFPEVR